mmetsp:Transcript_19448/g.77623  ORF Transcript_19448/g.77623 Transcript_19448/m.77623 type:complete len:88 (-) Transcript_19448:1199-1462(-)
MSIVPKKEIGKENVGRDAIAVTSGLRSTVFCRYLSPALLLREQFLCHLSQGRNFLLVALKFHEGFVVTRQALEQAIGCLRIVDGLAE